MIIPPYRVSLSGGGIKGFAHIGALEILEEHGLLHTVKEYLGISAGALCAFAVCIGCSLKEIRGIGTALDFGQIRDLDPETVLNFPDTFGLDTGANVEKLLVALLKGKGIEPNITFQELAARKAGPALRVFATNMNTCIAEEFSALASPATEVRFAVQASMSVPIYFKPLKDARTGHLFLDGGIMCPSPMKYLAYEEQVTTLAIAFGDNHKRREKIETLSEFIFQLYYCLDYYESVQLKARWPMNTITIESTGVNMLDFEAGIDAKKRVIDAGRRAATAFLKSPGQKPVRRFSVV